MNEKVLCSKCLNLADEADCAFYSSISFRQHKGNIIHGTKICIALKCEEKTTSIDPFCKTIKKDVLVDDPKILNKENNCRHYKYNFLWPVTNFFRDIVI